MYYTTHRKEPQAPVCPRCGMEARVFFRDIISQDILCCSECAEKIDADDLAVEREENGYWDEVDAQVDRILGFMDNAIKRED